ncbi:glycine oxidase ThiO [Brevibacterium spongiae]|uniref:glycine oxidase n=1 Tax=Brevibacterium spongiae TaxID=2909672 RepID=A0ABY5STI9_9MICO|nr:glycine oxidase ThiO [Brevibacterium spongiae]UVI37514.1 glycine oxidase ThiO [Brevibacterium spongiae]
MHVIVVGAGIIGLSTAWHLRRLSAEVTIIDPTPGQGATHAAAGMIAPAAEVVWGQTPLYPLMQTSARLYPDFAAEVASATGADLGLTDTGTLVCAGDRADLQALRELRENQDEAGFTTELLTGSRARSLEPALSPSVAGAVRIPGDHSIDPRRITSALLTSFASGLLRRRVTGLVRDGGATVGVEVEDGSHLSADQVIIAAGTEANGITGVPVLPLRHVWGDVLRLRAPAELDPLLTSTIRGLVNGRPVYLVPRPDGEIVLGASSREDGRSGISAGAMHRLLQDGQRLVPGVLDCEVTDVTTRARPGSPDDLPLIGRVDDGCIVSTGYFRHGILLAPLGGRLSAELALGLRSDWLPDGALDSVDLQRFSADATMPASTYDPADDPLPTTDSQRSLL